MRAGDYDLAYSGGENTVRDRVSMDSWTCPGPAPNDLIVVEGRLRNPNLPGRMDHHITGPGRRECEVRTYMNPVGGPGETPPEEH